MYTTVGVLGTSHKWSPSPALLSKDWKVSFEWERINEHSVRTGGDS